MRGGATLRVLFVAGLASFLSGCGGDPGTGPVEVKWDRVTCERCRMVLSDRTHSAQVRYTDSGGRSRVVMFDDIGCAVVWLDDKPWKSAPSTEIWVTDHRDGHWIDARSAYYVRGHVTPMEYGLGAQEQAAGEAMTYEQAVAHIWEIEKRFNLHGADVRQQAGQRDTDPGPAAPSSTTSEHDH